MEILDRDLSWLHFNGRVLQEATSPDVPLYEKIKFLAIYSSNLDEFFRVRVSKLRRFQALSKSDRKAFTDVKPKKILKQIVKEVQQQQESFGLIFRQQILPELAEEGVFLKDERDLNEEQRLFASNYYQENIKPQLEIIWLDQESKTPWLHNHGLYLAVGIDEPGIPCGLIRTDFKQLNAGTKKLPRFVELPARVPSQLEVIFIEDIIRANLGEIIPNRPLLGAFEIKVSRDAELYLDEYEHNLVEEIKTKIAERDAGVPTRFLYDSLMPTALLDKLKERLGLTKHDLVPGARYHNFSDFFGFPAPKGKPHLKDTNQDPLVHPVLEKSKSLFDTIAGEDQLLHFPYQKYDYVSRFIDEATDDEQVLSIKMTLYRVATSSEIGKSLEMAARVGKQVTVFIEAKARFDEESNLYWGRRLEAVGAKVFYSMPNIKVHSKLLLIQRQEEGKCKNYTFIGTGNFNEKTAKLYADHALLTCDPRLADEVASVFYHLERRRFLIPTQHLMVSPLSSRPRLIEKIKREIGFAKEGKPAYMLLKMNSLEDPEMIEWIYKAKEAGVEVKMIVRGICRLPLAGADGDIEHPYIISILDRYLEHARVYLFGNGGNEELYIASADWMTRNLDRRVEIIAPIFRENLRNEIKEILKLQFFR